MPGYAHPEVREIEAALLHTPARLRHEHLQRLVDLIPSLVPDRLYTCEYIFFRVTQLRPESGGMALLKGQNLYHDLGLLLRAVSPESPLDAAAAKESVLPVEAIATRCQVRLGTVRRWGLMGLPLCYYILPAGRCALAVRQSALDAFVARQRIAPQRSAGRMTAQEREDIVAKGQRLQKSGGLSLPAVVRVLVEESGRSAATVRRLLAGAKAEAVAAPVRGNALSDTQRADLARRYKAGESVSALAARFHRSSSAIYRMLHESLVEQVLAMKIGYIASPEFAGARAARRCLGKDGLFTYPPELAPDSMKAPAGLPPYLSDLYTIPLLTREQEQALFRKYNFLKCHMAMLQERIRKRGYRATLLEEFEAYHQAAEHVRRILIRCNLRLVVSIAKRHIGPLTSLFELVSEGNVCLIRAVECYDYRREARFATYATWAISKHFARTVPETHYQSTKFITGQEKRFATMGDVHAEPWEDGESLAHMRKLLEGAVAHLTERERKVIESHFGTDGGPARTLDEIGKLFGVTRERVRQIEMRALVKLRNILGPDALDGLT